MPDALTPLVDSFLRWLPTLVLAWLAVFFGRTLRSGGTPLIERIARQSHPSLPDFLCRYSRRLTAVWTGYFAVAALLTTVVDTNRARLGLAVGIGAALFFVVERWLRLWLFPAEPFPGLIGQVRDTFRVWRRPG